MSKYTFKISTTHGYTNMLRNIEAAIYSLPSVDYELITPTQDALDKYFELTGLNVDTGGGYMVAYIEGLAGYTLDDFTSVSATGVRSAKSQPEIRQIILDDILYAQNNPVNPSNPIEEEEITGNEFTEGLPDETEPPEEDKKNILPLLLVAGGIYLATREG